MEVSLLRDNVELIIGFITLVSFALAAQWWIYKQKLETTRERSTTDLSRIEVTYKAEVSELTAQHRAEIEELKRSHDKECAKLTQDKLEKINELQAVIDKQLTEQQQKEASLTPIPLVQEVKVVYVKYIHIRRTSDDPVYRKAIKRIEKDIDVHSEYHYFRFNKYNRPNNEIVIKDASAGVVDLNILHPWKEELEFTDRPSKLNDGKISQNLENSDVYFTSTVYYNGFSENNEDIGMRMEMDTVTARMIADFSSIIGIDKLFTKPPDAYKNNRQGNQRTRITSLLELSPFVYYIEMNNLRKGESIMLDFHVDWGALD